MSLGGRSLPAVLVTATIGGLVLAAAAQAQTVTASCDTPPGQRDGCNRWYTTASVSLSWQWDAGGSIVSGCANGALTAEGREERTCRVDWAGTSTTKRIWIGIDRTAPQVLAPTSSRPPDWNGWFNHPVHFAFRGADQGSGLASCSSLTYGGPDGAGVTIRGICRDAVGHVGTGSFALNYDATPPAPPVAEALPGNHRVRLSWSTAPDTVAVVVRYRRSRSTLVYGGPATTFTDRKLRNRRRYRYLVTLIDQAGNRASDWTSAVPTASPLLSPADGARVRGAPLLVWKPVRRADYYNAQLVRHGRKVLSRWPRETRLQLRSTWRFAGHRRRLKAGFYCWYIWPGLGARSERRYGELLGKSCFRVVR